MSDNLFELYSQKILALATQMPESASIDEPTGHAKRRSPVCGSEIEVWLHVEGNQITEYSQNVNACALGQASSAIFGNHVKGCTLTQIQTLRDELQAFLEAKGPAPSAPFEDYAVLEPAQAHKNRHASILLPIHATLEATT